MGLLVVVLAILGAVEDRDVKIRVLAFKDVGGVGLDFRGASNEAPHLVMLQKYNVEGVFESATFVPVGTVVHCGWSAVARAKQRN